MKEVIDAAESLHGVLLVDKPRGLSSHDVVDRVRKLARTRRVGHTGTLDPLAEGLLLVCIGGATRVAQFLTGLTKEYTGAVRLGAISSTYDAEGEIIPQDQPLPRDARTVEMAMRAQMGLRTQLAPPFSAVKVRGKKLYEYARGGEEVPDKHRRVQIFRFDLVRYQPPDVHFRAKVSSGTYLRSMAHDLGIQLECGGYLASLRRESVGDFRVEDATPLPALIQKPDLLRERLLEVADALGHLPKLVVSAKAEKDLLHGRGFTAREIVSCEALPRASDRLLAVSGRGKALSIVDAEWRQPAGEAAEDESGEAERMFFRPVRVLNIT